MFLMIHFVLWTIVLFMIESGCFKFIYDRLAKLLSKNKIEANEKLKFGDEDVREEEMRIRLSEPTDFRVRIKDFRKIYPSLVG